VYFQIYWYVSSTFHLLGVYQTYKPCLAESNYTHIAGIEQYTISNYSTQHKEI